MGRTYADFTLTNGDDLIELRNGRIKESNLRRETIKFLVDTGADDLYITEKVQQNLKLHEWKTKLVKLADGRKVLCKVGGPVQVQWEDRAYTADAAIIPGLTQPISGVLPLENLVLKVNPSRQGLESADPDGFIGQLM